MSNPMMYVATMAVVTYLIRVLPLTLFNNPITIFLKLEVHYRARQEELQTPASRSDYIFHC